MLQRRRRKFLRMMKALRAISNTASQARSTATVVIRGVAQTA
jgi:hypothetical protein